jgi:hypothetical protein
MQAVPDCNVLNKAISQGQAPFQCGLSPLIEMEPVPRNGASPDCNVLNKAISQGQAPFQCGLPPLIEMEPVP